MGSTVAVGSLEITSNSESAPEMVKALTPPKEDAKQPRVVTDAGQAPEEPDNPLSRAAAELGKKGGEAAAKAREAKKAEEPAGGNGKTLDEAKAEEGEKGDVTRQDDDEEAKPKGNPRHDARARVLEATRQAAEAKRAREAAEQKAAQLEERLARLEAQVKPPAPEAERREAARPGNGKPAPDQFETYEEFSEALADWKIEERLKRITQENEVRTEAERHADRIGKTVHAFNERVMKAAEADAEMMNRVDPRLLELKPTFTLPPGTPASAANDIAQAIVESENAPQLLLHLSEHPEEMQRLMALPDSFAVFRSVGRLEAKLTGEPTTVPSRPSSAPPPMRPVNPSAVPGTPDVLGDLDFDTFAARMKARKR